MKNLRWQQQRWAASIFWDTQKSPSKKPPPVFCRVAGVGRWLCTDRFTDFLEKRNPVYVGVVLRENHLLFSRFLTSSVRREVLTHKSPVALCLASEEGLDQCSTNLRALTFTRYPCLPLDSYLKQPFARCASTALILLILPPSCDLWSPLRLVATLIVITSYHHPNELSITFLNFFSKNFLTSYFAF